MVVPEEMKVLLIFICERFVDAPTVIEIMNVVFLEQKVYYFLDGLINARRKNRKKKVLISIGFVKGFD